MKKQLLGLLLALITLTGCNSDREKGINKEKEKPEAAREKK